MMRQGIVPHRFSRGCGKDGIVPRRFSNRLQVTPFFQVSPLILVVFLGVAGDSG
jgi:hypothetical protein